jgi:hypothetical protein
LNKDIALTATGPNRDVLVLFSIIRAGENILQKLSVEGAFIAKRLGYLLKIINDIGNSVYISQDFSLGTTTECPFFVEGAKSALVPGTIPGEPEEKTGGFAWGPDWTLFKIHRIHKSTFLYINKIEGASKKIYFFTSSYSLYVQSKSVFTFVLKDLMNDFFKMTTKSVHIELKDPSGSHLTI